MEILVYAVNVKGATLHGQLPHRQVEDISTPARISRNTHKSLMRRQHSRAQGHLLL